MKFFKLLVITAFILTSCAKSESNDYLNQSEIINKTITVSKEQTVKFDSDFEKDMGVSNLNIDDSRKSFIDIEENKYYVPILPGYSFEDETLLKSDEDPEIKEVSVGVKFKIARLNPRNNPAKCQGDCKCGIGFRCGGSATVKIKVSSKSSNNDYDEFNYETREAIANQYINTKENYYIFEFVTKIDWKRLNDE